MRRSDAHMETAQNIATQYRNQGIDVNNIPNVQHRNNFNHHLTQARDLGNRAQDGTSYMNRIVMPAYNQIVQREGFNSPAANHYRNQIAAANVQMDDLSKPAPKKEDSLRSSKFGKLVAGPTVKAVAKKPLLTKPKAAKPKVGAKKKSGVKMG